MSIERFADWFLRITIFAIVVVVGVGAPAVAIKACRDEERYGPMHCGDVEVTTPKGQRATEHQCWRSKP